uniref:Uncharacterized protein n=1 Tax=Leptobrachium leishanense TaxID=445787 RepID=A0A8C5LPW7_9ANUR
MLQCLFPINTLGYSESASITASWAHNLNLLHHPQSTRDRMWKSRPCEPAVIHSLVESLAGAFLKTQQYLDSLLDYTQQNPRGTSSKVHIPATEGARGPLTPEEKARRRALDLCFYCGGPLHRISACPLRPPKPGTKCFHAPVKPICTKPAPVKTTRLMVKPVPTQPKITAPTNKPIKPSLGKSVPALQKKTSSAIKQKRQAPKEKPLSPPTPRRSLVIKPPAPKRAPASRKPEPRAIRFSARRDQVTQEASSEGSDQETPMECTEPESDPEMPMEQESIDAEPAVPMDSEPSQHLMVGVARTPEPSPLPPCCTYASNGTVVRKEDLEVFELALRLREAAPLGHTVPPSPRPSDESESEEEDADAGLDLPRQTARRTQGPPGQHKGYIGVAGSVCRPAGMIHRTAVPRYLLETDYNPFSGSSGESDLEGESSENCPSISPATYLCHAVANFRTPATKTISSAPCQRSAFIGALFSMTPTVRLSVKPKPQELETHPCLLELEVEQKSKVTALHPAGSTELADLQPAGVQEPCCTEVQVQEPCCTEVQVQEPCCTEVQVQEPCCTEVQVQEPCCTEVQVQEPCCTEVQVQEPCCTEVQVQEPCCTEVQVQEPCCTEVQVQEPCCTEVQVQEPCCTEVQVQEPCCTEVQVQEPCCTEVQVQEPCCTEVQVQEPCCTEVQVQEPCCTEVQVQEPCCTEVQVQEPCCTEVQVQEPCCTEVQVQEPCCTQVQEPCCTQVQEPCCTEVQVQEPCCTEVQVQEPCCTEVQVQEPCCTEVQVQTAALHIADSPAVAALHPAGSPEVLSPRGRRRRRKAKSLIAAAEPCSAKEVAAAEPRRSPRALPLRSSPRALPHRAQSMFRRHFLLWRLTLLNTGRQEKPHFFP